MPGPTFNIDRSAISTIAQHGREPPVFQGDQAAAQAMLNGLASTFVGDHGRIASGNFRLVSDGEGAPQLEARRYFHSADNDRANAFIQSLVQKAYGEPAAQALGDYLARTGNKLGTHSLINMVQGWRAEHLDSTQRTDAVDQATVKDNVRLNRDFLRQAGVLGPAAAPQASVPPQATGVAVQPPPVQPPPVQPPPVQPSPVQPLQARTRAQSAPAQIQQPPTSAQSGPAQVQPPDPPSQAQEPVQPAPAQVQQAPARPVDLARLKHPEVYAANRIDFVSELGSGSFGGAYEVTIDGQPGFVLKELKEPVLLALALFNRSGKAVRNDRLQESMAVYLKAKPTSNWSDDLDVTVPTHFMIRRTKSAPVEWLTIDETRALLKNQRDQGLISAVCVGQAMHKAPGESLASLIKAGTLNADDHKSIARSMLTTLGKLAERGFVHRDIKPDNLFYDRQTGKVTFIDTGMLYKIPKPQPGQRAQLPTFGTGTPLYASPYVVGGFFGYGANADLHSSAMTLLEIGYPSAFAVMSSVMFDDTRNSAEKPAEFIRRLDKALDWTIDNANQQYQSLKDAQDELVQAQEDGRLNTDQARIFRQRLIDYAEVLLNQGEVDVSNLKGIDQAIRLLQPAPDPTTEEGFQRLLEASTRVEGLINECVKRYDEGIAMKADMQQPDTIGGFARECLRRAIQAPSVWNTRERSVQNFNRLLQEPALQAPADAMV